MSVSALKLGLVACALAASSMGSAVAGPALSWNLSRDMFLSATGISQPQGVNPVGAWTFMHGPYPSQLLPTFQSPCASSFPTNRCWRDATSNLEPSVFINELTQMVGTAFEDAAMPKMHPAPTSPVVVRWTSPIKGRIQMLGRFSDADHGSFGSLGDGVTWKIVKNGVTAGPFGATNSTSITGDGDTFYWQVSVKPGDVIDFIVEAGPNQDYFYDTTELDVLITAQK